MKNRRTEYIRKKIQGKSGRKRWSRIFSVMMALVVFVTTYALILPALTAEGNTYCNIGDEDHIHTLACYSNPEADAESAMDWENTLPEECLQSRGEQAGSSLLPDVDTLLAIAQSQIGYRESEKNYAVAEDGKTIKGYSRYGAWKGEAYEPWALSFAAFCLSYAGANQAVLSDLMAADAADQAAWISTLKEAGCQKLLANGGQSSRTDSLLSEKGTDVYDYAPGDLVFLQTETDGSVSLPHAGFVLKTGSNQITLIEGDRDNRVCKNSYRKDSDQIVAVFSLCQNTEDQDAGTDKANGQTMEAADEDSNQHNPDEYNTAEQASIREVQENIEQILENRPFSLTCQGQGYTVTASYGKDAGLPEGVSLEVKEIKLDRPYYKQAQAALEEAGSSLASARFFDISFIKEGKEIEPQADVSISFSWNQAEAISDNTRVKAIHLPQGKAAEIIDTEIEAVPDAAQDREGAAQGQAVETVTFTADSFSVYGIVYTVDFHYQVNGKMYDFSIPGGGFVSFTDLVEVLGIAKQDGAGQEFVSNIANVEFSDESLVKVAQITDDITAQELKEQLGVEPEYSSELTEAEIAENLAQKFIAPDWVLVSLKAFDTEETLTVTMKNGDRFVIKVTDAAITNADNVITGKYHIFMNTARMLIDGSLNNGEELTALPTSGDKYIWEVVKLDNGNYTIKNVYTGKYLSFSAEVNKAMTTSETAEEIKIINSDGNINIKNADETRFIGWGAPNFVVKTSGTPSKIKFSWVGDLKVASKINYQALPNGWGSVSKTSETIEIGGVSEGATATAANGKYFVGWFDQNYNLVGTNESFVPTGDLISNGVAANLI